MLDTFAMRPAIAFAILFLLACGQEPASARSLEDCEKIRDWHAYNSCLASFGPKRGQRNFQGLPAGDPEQRVYGRGGKREAAGKRRASAIPGMSVERVRGGRVRATLDLGGSSRRR